MWEKNEGGKAVRDVPIILWCLQSIWVTPHPTQKVPSALSEPGTWQIWEEFMRHEDSMETAPVCTHVALVREGEKAWTSTASHVLAFSNPLLLLGKGIYWPALHWTGIPEDNMLSSWDIRSIILVDLGLRSSSASITLCMSVKKQPITFNCIWGWAW